MLSFSMLRQNNINFVCKQVIARVMCGISTTLRFPGQLNGCVTLPMGEVGNK